MSYCKESWLTRSGDGKIIGHAYPCHAGRFTVTFGRNVSMLIIHYTGNKGPDTAKANCQFFHDTYDRDASAHFFVDETSVWQSVEMVNIAYHASNWDVNTKSIGIEMCCSGDYKVSEITKKNAAYLIVKLMHEYDIKLANIKRHWDINGKECPAQMAGKDNEEWLEFKDYIQKLYTASLLAEPQKTAKKYRGQYQLGVARYLRVDAGLNKTRIKYLKKGSTVNCYGKYSLSAAGKVWYYVDAIVDGIKYTGFVPKAKTTLLTKV